MCTNGFTAALFPELEVVPARNQVLITEKLDNNPLDSGYHMDKGYVYFRNYEAGSSLVVVEIWIIQVS
ncbi:MAG: hypothetical protein IPJ13_25425 [Saprospiraceae bacterium]|nr:hypothetical protein [Saprospiraceae bacterium]